MLYCKGLAGFKVFKAMHDRNRECFKESLGQEDPLEKEMATHSSILAWEIPRQRRLVGYSPWGHRESDMAEHEASSVAYLGLIFSDGEQLVIILYQKKRKRKLCKHSIIVHSAASTPRVKSTKFLPVTITWKNAT